MKVAVGNFFNLTFSVDLVPTLPFIFGITVEPKYGHQRVRQSIRSMPASVLSSS